MVYHNIKLPEGIYGKFYFNTGLILFSGTTTYDLLTRLLMLKKHNSVTQTK
jgi:hypothetical protein